MVKEPKNMLHGKVATEKEKPEVVGTFELMPLAKRKTAAACTLRGYIDRLEAALVTATTLSENQHAAIEQYRTRITEEGKARDELMERVRQQSDEIDSLRKDQARYNATIDELSREIKVLNARDRTVTEQRDRAELKCNTYRDALAIVSGRKGV